MKCNTDLILNRIKQAKNIQKDAELARFLGITSGLLANWKTRNTYNLDILLTKCSDISLDWLLLGKGEMLRSEQEQLEQQQPKPQQPLQSINQKIDYVSQLIDTQNKYIHALEAEIKQLKEQIEQLEK